MLKIVIAFKGRICVMKNTIFILLVFFIQTLRSSQDDTALQQREKEVQTHLQPILLAPLIVIINEYAKSKHRILTLRLHYNPLLNTHEMKWFTTDVPDDMHLVDFHAHTAKALDKRKKTFKLVKRGTAEHTELDSSSQKTLKESGVEHQNSIWAMEKS